MRLDAGNIAFAALALVAATVCVALGLWQLDRLEERRTRNELRRERMAAPPVELASGGALAARADSLAWRRVEVRGRFDYANEIVLRARSRMGRPGVQLLTPLRRAEGPAVLVLRGWLPAADGLHASLGAARPPEAGDPAPARGAAPDTAPAGTVTVRGLLAPGDPAGSEGPAPPRRFTIDGEEHPVMMRLDLQAAERAVPYPLAPLYVRATGGAGDAATGGPLRPPAEPELDAGPHLMYAIQWFAFALIALVGTGIYLSREHRTARRPRSPDRREAS